ncbi:unnamed protein product [Ranitomeya imitator]|uniref:Uncharacterized protein n=1 Tax=Ranitomeya imitator TaxID=111125 RepID=A0ABN9L7P9_9NEOB|nr:unnamed protein product [Ranitomeya imitator]
MNPPPFASAHAGLQRMGSGSSNCGTTNPLIKICTDHKGGINWLSVSPDGCHLLTASEDCTARLWRTSDHQCCKLLQGVEPHIHDSNRRLHVTAYRRSCGQNRKKRQPTREPANAAAGKI